MIFKWLRVPESNETKEIEVVQLWEVRWESRDGPFSSDSRPEVECLKFEQEAIDFKQSLENAFGILRYSGNITKVKIGKAK